MLVDGLEVLDEALLGADGNRRGVVLVLVGRGPLDDGMTNGFLGPLSSSKAHVGVVRGKHRAFAVDDHEARVGIVHELPVAFAGLLQCDRAVDGLADHFRAEGQHQGQKAQVDQTGTLDQPGCDGHIVDSCRKQDKKANQLGSAG